MSTCRRHAINRTLNNAQDFYFTTLMYLVHSSNADHDEYSRKLRAINRECKLIFKNGTLPEHFEYFLRLGKQPTKREIGFGLAECFCRNCKSALASIYSAYLEEEKIRREYSCYNNNSTVQRLPKPNNYW